MTDTREIWVDIKNYEGKYRISNKGFIRRASGQNSPYTVSWHNTSFRNGIQSWK